MYDNVKRFPKSGDWMKRPRWGKWYQIKTVEYELGRTHSTRPERSHES